MIEINEIKAVIRIKSKYINNVFCFSVSLFLFLFVSIFLFSKKKAQFA